MVCVGSVPYYVSDAECAREVYTCPHGDNALECPKIVGRYNTSWIISKNEVTAIFLNNTFLKLCVGKYSCMVAKDYEMIYIGFVTVQTLPQKAPVAVCPQSVRENKWPHSERMWLRKQGFHKDHEFFHFNMYPAIENVPCTCARFCFVSFCYGSVISIANILFDTNYKDKTVVRPYYLYNENSYTGKASS